LHGYSELEIAKKRAALDRVLLPESVSVHHRRLRDAGFGSTRTWFRCMNFVSIVAYS
jgi:tRNA (cmo5U34)-methyltransferase